MEETTTQFSEMVDTSLRSMIAKHFVESRKLKYVSKERDSYFRASGLGYICNREEVLCNLLKVDDRKQKHTVDSMLTFAHGHGLHYAIQNKVLPATDTLIGTWICLECGNIFGKPESGKELGEMLAPQPKYCNKCDGNDFYFKELYFKDDVYRIGGHPDGFLKIPGMDGVGLLEVKSVHRFNAAKAQEAPFEEHIVQAHVYMWLARVTWAKFIYWNKEGAGLSALIEHTIYRDDNLINNIKTVLESIWKGIDTQTLPKRVLCSDQGCSRASRCLVSAECFGNTNKLVNIYGSFNV